MASEPKNVASLMWLESFANTPEQATTRAGAGCDLIAGAASCACGAAFARLPPDGFCEGAALSGVADGSPGQRFSSDEAAGCCASATPVSATNQAMATVRVFMRLSSTVCSSWLRRTLSAKNGGRQSLMPPAVRALQIDAGHLRLRVACSGRGPHGDRV